MEFKEFKIKNVANLVTDYVANGSFKSLKENVLVNEQPDFAVLIRLVDYNNNFNGPFKYIDEKSYNFLSKTKLFGGEIIISNVGANVGTVFKAPFLKCNMTLAPNSILVKFNGDNDYFYYYFKSKFGQHKLKSILSGSAQPKFNKTDFKNLEIEVPDEYNQHKIGKSLKIIDSKIEINKKIIANLEEISQTLFKRWFVDFEFPDENGNPYKSSGGEMVDSELGEIPERWEVVKLKDIVYQKKDTFNPKKSNELKVLHFSLPAFDSSQNPVIDDVNAIKSNKWIIDENCILFSKMNPSTRRIWLTSNDGKYLNVASSEFVVLKSDNSYKNAFIYNICTSDKFSEFLNSNTTGSTNSRQRVKPDIAISYKLAFHNETSMLFSNKVEPYLEKIKVIRNENQKLAELRDTLLPKLMSGEIEIPDDIEVNEDELSI